MSRLFKRILAVLAFAGIVSQSAAFSLLGPFDTWQTAEIGYGVQLGGEEIGGPMNLGEEYRWPMRTIYYAFDPSFVNFFGQQGMIEARKAVKIINDLPRFSKMSESLNEFPTDTTRFNYRAGALGIVDLKTIVLALLVEEMGLATPDRFVWTLRDRVAIPGGFEYQVIMRNFDPVTQIYSPWVNDVLYTYVILDPVPNAAVAYADAVEISVDPFAIERRAVAAIQQQGTFAVGNGRFVTGLTRDDVGGLRYLYSRHNLNIEGLVPNLTTNVAGAGSPWGPVSGGGSVEVALRPGVDKIVFKEVKFDSTFGFFVPFTNSFSDTYITNSRPVKQTVSRGVLQPDILFAAADLNRSLLARTGTEGWINFAATNSLPTGEENVTGGPGTIQPPVAFVFNKIGPFLISDSISFLDEATSLGTGFVWGIVDGTTNDPVIFPSSVSIQQLEEHALRPR